jgi:hypothetical protein
VNIGCSAACLPAALSAGIVGDYPKTSTALRPARLSALSPAGIMPQNPWDMHVPGPPAGRPGGEAIPPDGGCVLGRIDEYRSVY